MKARLAAVRSYRLVPASMVTLQTACIAVAFVLISAALTAKAGTKRG